MSDKNYYKLIVEDQHFIHQLWEKFCHDNLKPTGRWFEKQESLDARLECWETVNESMVDGIVVLYKYHFPEIYDDFELNNFGFTSGHSKTFYLYVSKYNPDDYEGEEHA